MNIGNIVLISAVLACFATFALIAIANFVESWVDWTEEE